MANSASFTIGEYDPKENATMQLNPGPITSVNYDAKRDAIDDLKLVMGNIILGEVRYTNLTIKTTESVAEVTDPNAQRERKWLVTYRDNTEFLDVADTIENAGYGKLYNTEVPTADNSLLDNKSDDLDLAIPGVAAWITAFEAVHNSPTGGNEIEVISIKHVGRSS
jgi:hypothetical protein